MMPVDENFTTQAAANHLGVSRQHLVDLLEQGKMPFHRAGTHRRIAFKDLLEYEDKRDRARPFDYSFRANYSAIPSSQSPARSVTYRRPIYNTDYNVDQTLGGSLRSTSNTGRVTTYSQPLGGGYDATTSGGTTYHAEQNLGGGYRFDPY